ncbi:MAG: 4Fe-4S dicluster domain-containing protein, partial [Oceanidesulfovibrio sp.]
MPVDDSTPAGCGLAFGLSEEMDQTRDKCTACGACVKHCPFLRRYGDPSTIAGRLASGSIVATIAFECSLCGLCGAICPHGVEPSRLFLAMRRNAVEQGAADMKPYRRLLAYEARGHSRLFASYAVPEGCNTVMFPGCTLPGTRPAAMAALTQRLRGMIPNLGVVLDCCHKPSHDLGRQEFFEQRFGAIRDRLASAVTAYIGFDPTADSLHVGSLVPIMALAWLQRCGHKPLALVGGATGLVGDPSGKTEARRMLTREQIDANAAAIAKQIAS